MERVKELHSRGSARFSAALVIMLLLMVVWAGEMMASGRGEQATT